MSYHSIAVPSLEKPPGPGSPGHLAQTLAPGASPAAKLKNCGSCLACFPLLTIPEPHCPRRCSLTDLESFLVSLVETGPLVCPAASCSIALRHRLAGLGKDTTASSLLHQMSSRLFPHLVVMVGGRGHSTWDHPPIHQVQPVMFGFQFCLKVGCLLGFPSG